MLVVAIAACFSLTVCVSVCWFKGVLHLLNSAGPGPMCLSLCVRPSRLFVEDCGDNSKVAGIPFIP